VTAQSKVKAVAALRAAADGEQARLDAALAAAAEEFDSAAEAVGGDLQRSISAAVASIKHAHAEAAEGDRAIAAACGTYLKALEAAVAALRSTDGGQADGGDPAGEWTRELDDAGVALVAAGVTSGTSALAAAHEARQREGARVYRHLAGLVRQVAALREDAGEGEGGHGDGGWTVPVARSRRAGAARGMEEE
jgi:hypothetical protein